MNRFHSSGSSIKQIRTISMYYAMLFFLMPFLSISMSMQAQDGLMVYCTNEKLVQSFLEVIQAMHRISLKQLTSTYLQGGQTSVNALDQNIECFVSNGSSLTLRTSVSMLGKSFELFNNAGQVLHEGIIDSMETHLSLSAFPSGTYALLLRHQSHVFCIVKLDIYFHSFLRAEGWHAKRDG